MPTNQRTFLVSIDMDLSVGQQVDQTADDIADLLDEHFDNVTVKAWASPSDSPGSNLGSKPISPIAQSVKDILAP